MCECKQKPLDNKLSGSEDASIWGPKFWRILHTFAENAGVLLDESYDDKVAVTLGNLIMDLHSVLPCQVCKSHARYYISTHPLNFYGLKRIELRNAVRTYLYEFHNHVRTTNNQPINVKLEDLESLYSIPLTKEQIADLPININQSKFIWAVQYYQLAKLFGYY